jgi:hypothetical protein
MDINLTSLKKKKLIHRKSTLIFVVPSTASHTALLFLSFIFLLLNTHRNKCSIKVFMIKKLNYAISIALEVISSIESNFLSRMDSIQWTRTSISILFSNYYYPFTNQIFFIMKQNTIHVIIFLFQN